MQDNIKKINDRKTLKLSLKKGEDRPYSLLAVLKPLKKARVFSDHNSNQKLTVLKNRDYREQSKTNLIKKAKQAIALLGFLLLTQSAFASSPASVVHDPTNAVTLTDALNLGTKAFNVTNQINNNMFQMRSAIGTATTAFTNPILTGLSILGGCSDPFGDIKSTFLNLRSLKPNLNVCSLLSGSQAYTELLFIPFDQMGKGITHKKLAEIARNREQAIQTSTVNALALGAQVKKELPAMRRRIETLTAEAERSPNIAAQAQIQNKFLAIIANELVKLNGQVASANEMNGSGLSRTINLMG